MLMDIIKARHSIRKYTDEQIRRDDLEKILEAVKETIGVGVNEKAALSSDKNCPFVYINFDFTLVNKVASL